MNPGPRTTARSNIVYADGPQAPRMHPRSLQATAALSQLQEVFGWTVQPLDWLDAVPDPVLTMMSGVGMRAAVKSGRVRPISQRLSDIPGLMLGRYRPEVAVVGGIRDGQGWRCTSSVGWAPEAAAAASSVVIEEWPASAAPFATPAITGKVVEVVARTDPADPPQQSAPGEAERAIAAQAASLIPQGATVQWGPGALGRAFVEAIDIPVGVHSGLVTDELVTLAGRDLLVGSAVTAYLWGGQELVDLAAAGRVELASVSTTHDLRALGLKPALFAFNTALQVGLDGSANVETIGGRVISGPGGHPDFCLGAARSPGGLSVIGVRSMLGEQSAVVATPETVSTPAGDVDVVITEHGVADLRGLTRAERAEAMIGVAHPQVRTALRQGLS